MSKQIMGRIKTSVFNTKDNWLYFVWGAESIVMVWIFFLSGQFMPSWSFLWTQKFIMNWAAVIGMIVAALICLTVAIITKDLNISHLFNKSWLEKEEGQI